MCGQLKNDLPERFSNFFKYSTAFINTILGKTDLLCQMQRQPVMDLILSIK